ncbi:Mitochondrial acidic protein mam33 [Kickxella alabastrina]|uniref:Mitochondrial acidic protein mam33 n=1 Tax=Kickxella alabastrina TaxID=61397 RepID=A0ACC1IAR5_9FUNG|nr:Mitochondrial acidic protein mam33 [Kickxella alabastrina]
MMKSVARLLTTSASRGVARSSVLAGRNVAACAVVSSSRMTAGSALSIRALSTSTPMRANGAIDSDLAHTLGEEIEYEAKQAAEEGEPEFIQAFTNKTGFKLKTKLGDSQVVMSKQFGNETITVSFDVSEILNIDDPIADISVYRENEQGDAVKEAEKKAEDAPEDFPIYFTATFAKPGAPVLHMELECEEGEIGVDHMKFLPDEESAIAKSLEKDWVRKQVYCGPIYGQLSDDLKENIDEFLVERNVDTALTLFMQDFIEYKEQGEYLHWLKNFKSFIDA